MTKSINIFAVSAVAFLGFTLALTMTASAASITNVEYSNGDVTIQGNAGQSVSGKVRVVVPANQEVEYMEFDVVSDSLAPVCVNVNRLQEGTHFVQIPGDVKFPPNVGMYSLNVSTHGIFGGLSADDCVGDQNGSQSFPNLRTVAGSTSVGSGNSMIEALQKQIADLLKMIADLQKPKPVEKPACPPTGNTAMVQSWLLSNGYAAGFNAAGVFAPTGHWGSITTAAFNAAMAACK